MIHQEAPLLSLKKSDFTIVILPDTQFYCDTRLKLSKQWGHGDLRKYFFHQTEWIRDNKDRLKIVFALHEGDIVQTDDPEEWEIAQKAMSTLDDHVPYCLCLGDHDMGFRATNSNPYGGEKATSRNTEFNNYFPLENFSNRSEFGGSYPPGRHDNAWYHFVVSGIRFMVISLEFHPRDEVLDWANGIVALHPTHRVILLTHSYLDSTQKRTHEEVKLSGNSGEKIWERFVRKHSNIFMVLCGHHYGEATLISTGDLGNEVFQLLSDYQHLNDGGEAWLRYMVFRPTDNLISVYTYNPKLGEFNNEPSSRFDLNYKILG